MPRTRRPQPVHFYPRPPRGGRRVFLDEDQSDILISIHALREEGDRVRFLRSSQRHNFYPRPPRGGRLLVRVCTMLLVIFLSTPSARRATSYLPGTAIVDLFLSTPSARRATARQGQSCGRTQISIHALREEGDSSSCAASTPSTNFYPRPPRGGRRVM